jgi:hypothetical protein
MPVNWTEMRLKRLKLLHKEGFSATIIAGKLGPAFTKNIVLRKIHQLDEERLARAKVLAARKAAKARLLKRASKVIDAPRQAGPASKERASAVAQVKAEPIRIVAPVPLPANPPRSRASSSSTCARDTAAGHWATIDRRDCSAARRRSALVHGASTISASRSRVWAAPCSTAKFGELSGSDSWRFKS